MGNSKALVEDPIIADRIVLAPWSADLDVMPLAGRIQLLWLLTQQLATWRSRVGNDLREGFAM
jgi:hypothetical protein